MKKIKAFTMLEILITAIVLGIGILTLHRTITHIKTVNERTFQTMIANQLATEGAEILYQTRNTNFLRYESDKEIFVEKCINNRYLKNGEAFDTQVLGSSGCNGNRMLCYDPCLAKFKSNNNINRCRLALDYYACITGSNYTGILNTGFYYIVNNNGSNSIIQCTGDYTNTSEEDCLNNENECCYRYRNEYSIYLENGVRTPYYNGMQINLYEMKYGIFYRKIEGMGVYDMSKNELGGKLLGTNELANTNAQEFRFCSTVARQGGENPAVEICSTMTNFIE